MKKGITPVISIIVLLLIAIAMAGAAWTYISGTMFGMISKSFDIPIGGAYCQDGRIILQIRNTAQGNLTVEDIVAVTSPNVDGEARGIGSNDIDPWVFPKDKNLYICDPESSCTTNEDCPEPRHPLGRWFCHETKKECCSYFCNSVDVDALTNMQLAPGQSVRILNTDCCNETPTDPPEYSPGGCTSGSHTINLVTQSTVIHQQVVCP